MKEILAKFRPLAGLARDLGVGYKRVSKWSERESVPAAFDLRLVEIARRRGFELSLEEIARARVGSESSSTKDDDACEQTGGAA